MVNYDLPNKLVRNIQGDKQMDNKVTLVIMAAGMGSRFGGGIKQLAQVGPNGEIIMDYSIYDAVKAGVNKIVFIIRHDFEDKFRELIGDRISKIVETEYVYQELDMLPEGFTAEGRQKPWGTGHAILCCKGKVNEPFIIINADDYYGYEAYDMLVKFLKDKENNLNLGMAGFVLKNTLSDNGTVTRGVCALDEKNMLQTVKETYDIIREADGVIRSQKSGEALSDDAVVSMNMWACTPAFIDALDEKFTEFMQNLVGDMKKEFLLPIIIEDMLNKGEASVECFKSNDKWFGVTYAEDKQLFIDSIAKLIEEGKYPNKLIG